MPRTLAVCRLMTNWNLVDCKTGGSPARLSLRVVGEADQHTNPSYPLALPVCPERPDGRTTEQCDEVAPFQSIELHLLPLAKGGSITDWLRSRQGRIGPEVRIPE